MVSVFLSHRPEARALYYGDKALAGLRAFGSVRLNESEEVLPLDRLLEASRGCQFIVSERLTEAPAALFANAPDLVAFVRCAVDIRNVDVTAASANGILVTRASAGFVPAVAELIIGMMVDLGRGVSKAVIDYRAGRQPPVRMGRQLAGSTLGIIGYGSIGRYLARLGQALGMRVLVTDPYVSVAETGIAQMELDALLAEADFVVCLAVANEETENLIDAAAFARMKRSAFFVNPSRGDLVDETALETALREGRIAGAALDVGRAPDQMPTPHLAALPNVTATPHVGGLTLPAIEHQALETVAQVADIVQGRAPKGAVNADAATRLRRLSTPAGRT